MNTFGPQQGPPKIRCLFCDYSMPHQHQYGEVPLLPCSACWVGWHEQCDPNTYFCCCFDSNCAQRWSNQ